MSDLIDRQAAIEALNNIEIPRNASWYQYYQQALTAVGKLPPAQPMRGKWERDGHHIKCDQCGEWMCDRDREGWDIPKNYCPNCGAKMEVTA